MRPSKSGLHTLTIMPLSPAMQMLGAFAEFERAMLRERTKAGLERAARIYQKRLLRNFVAFPLQMAT
jgi:hypothetical protein